MVKTICRIQHKKRIEAGKNCDKDRKALYILMNNSVYGKNLEKWTSRTTVYITKNI